MKCEYCGTVPNNSTTDKTLKVCSCYRLHKQNGVYIQHYKDGSVTRFAAKKE